MTESWTAIESIMSTGESIIYFSLDLGVNQGDARVKVYIAHPAIFAMDIAQKHAAICQYTDTYEIQRSCSHMAGGSLGSYLGKPLLSCFAFRSTTVAHAIGTIHFPVEGYTDNDEIVQDRVEKYMNEASVSPVFRRRYRKVVSAVQRRALNLGKGIHSWVSLKQQPEKRLTNTFYLSPQLFGPMERNA
jgi:tryptophanase